MLPSDYLQGSSNLQPTNQANFLQPTVTGSYLQPAQTLPMFQGTYNPNALAVATDQTNAQAQDQSQTPTQTQNAPQTAVGGSTAASSPQNMDFINQSYNTRLAGLQGLYDVLQPQQERANLNALNQYQNQLNNLQIQRAQGERNRAAAKEQLAANKARGLEDIRRQIQSMGMNYANQLGALGAGDSSAYNMINQAIGGVASRNRANVMQQANQQQRAMDIQQQDAQMQYDNAIKGLEDWKSNTLNDIATRFLQQKQAIQQQMATAQGDRYTALAQADASYTQQAMQQLAALEAQYRQQAQDMISQYNNLASPQVTVNPQLQQYAVNPISAGQVASIGQLPTTSAGNQPSQTYYPTYRQRDLIAGF